MTTDPVSPEIAVSFAVDEELKLLHKAGRTLPAHAVKDLLSIGVCIRCVLRLFGLHNCAYSCPLPSPSILSSSLGNEMELEEDKVVNGIGEHSLLPSQELKIETDICRICLGVLQFLYCEGQETVVRKDCANDFASVIARVIKQEGHQMDNFSLEVSLPPVIMENEQAVCLYMKKKYESELWYPEKFTSGRISTKDVLKLSITNPLETLLGVKSGQSSFRIRLTYNHPDPSMKIQNTVEKNQCNKRRKTGMVVFWLMSIMCYDQFLISCMDRSDVRASDEYELAKVPLKGSVDCEISDCFKCLPEKVNKPCHLTLLCNSTPIYVGGRYLKYSRNVSQSRWIIDDERMGEASVEEIIGDNILPMCQGDSYKFHAAGREDIDVRMLGSGRPFLVEIQNARIVPSEVSIKEIEKTINSLEGKLVRVKNLKVLGSQGWTLMREGEAEKQKQYTALVWIPRSLTDDDLKTISSLEDLQILQRTPIRVLHRRSPLEREKIIHWMNIERIAESPQYFLLHLCTQAGTYIKEFVHGDLGRTHPSVGSILGCRAEILQLDVTDVKMDCFLDE
ncbi:hypothetical protein LguiA_006911 [Lonicera macranthoides]